MAEKTNIKKSRAKLILIIIAAVILTLIVSAIIRCSVMEKRCEETVLPENLTAEETVRQLVDYWNDGNLKGLYLICDEYMELSNYAENRTPYYFGEDMKISVITKLEEIEELPENYENYDDRNYTEMKVFRLDTFTTGFDNKLSWRSNSSRFVLVEKATEDSPWKVGAMFTGL